MEKLLSSVMDIGEEMLFSGAEEIKKQFKAAITTPFIWVKQCKIPILT